MSTVSESLVNLAMGIRFEDLPSDVVREAGRRVLDALGCIIAGSTEPTSRQVTKAVLGLAAAQESSILGTRDLTSCEKATLVNCTSLRFLDYMDGHPGPYPGHACFNIPPILAVAERVGASGEQSVTAIVIAYEIMARFQECAGLPDLTSRGWSGSTNLEFSVPLAIAPLLGLDRERAVNALGISATHSNALDISSHGQMPASKSIVDGMTAMNAVVATLIAQQGVSGPRDVIEGSGGYVSVVAGSCDYGRLVVPVGRHKILETYNKWCNTVKCGQTAVAAALQLVQEHHGNWRNIAALEIGLARHDSQSQTDGPSHNRTRPKSRDSANHSVQYGVAAALVDGELGPDQFKAEKLDSQEILGLIDRTSVYWEEAHDTYWPSANPATIKIRTTDGQELSKTLVFAPGHPSNPLPDEVLEQKFRQLARTALDAGQIEAVIAATRQLADMPDVRALTRIVRSLAHA